MKYLLIDFGASLIKIAIYDSIYKNILNVETIPSPFIKNYKIKKSEVKSILYNIVSKNNKVDGIVCCSILGGSYHKNYYYSWKNNPYKNKQSCIVSGIFSDTPSFHIHCHFSNHGQDDLRILGHIYNIPIYSCLGDTNCVIESLPLNSNNVCINIGTGSQVIYLKNKSIHVDKYIPAGRAFLVYQKFFSSLGKDFFVLLNSVSIEDVIKSNLNIDINVFEQSHEYNGGGIISNINEYNFSIDNLMSSILKKFVIQYKKYIFLSKKKEILLTGGIPKKIKILPDLFKHFYPSHKITILSGEIESTHLGMTKYIDKYLN